MRRGRRENEDGKKKSSDELPGPVITHLTNRGGSDDKRLANSPQLQFHPRFVV